MEISNMISETTFARGYSSFWMEYFPWLNSYSQTVNAYQLNRISAPCPELDKAEHRSINNTIAFFCFRNITSKLNCSLEETKDEVLQYMTRFPRNNVLTYEFNSYDQYIINGLLKNLQKIPEINLLFDPFFSGCGIIDNCRGDILQGNKLIEVKSGNRNIQPADIKQLIVYLALDWISSSNKYNIHQVEIYNPRVGFSWTTDTDDLFRSVTSFTKEEALEQLTKYLVMQSEEMVIE